MPREPLPVTQADVRRALRGAVAAGVEIARVEINPRNGNIIIRTVNDLSGPFAPYDAWKAKSNAG